MKSSEATAPRQPADTLVLVTGASGFVASHVVRELLRRGFRVRGTVRSLKNKAKVDPIRALNVDGRLELVEADLTNEDGWESALSGCDFVQHVASPFPMSSDESCVRIAVEGTMNVLRACSQVRSIRKVVLTSSTVAIMEGQSPHQTFDETMWTNTDDSGVSFYAKSKVEAERAAWDFHRQLQGSGDNHHFALSVINPGFVLGPPLIDEQGTSVTLIRQMLCCELPAIPALQYPMVDVRDVALCHVEAMLRKEADGERIVAAAQPSLWFVDVARALKDEFKEQGYCFTTMQAPSILVRLMALWDKNAAGITARLGMPAKIDNGKARRMLGIDFRDPRDSAISMAYALIERGIVPRTKRYRGCPQRHKIDGAPEIRPETEQTFAF